MLRGNRAARQPVKGGTNESTHTSRLLHSDGGRRLLANSGVGMGRAARLRRGNAFHLRGQVRRLSWTELTQAEGPVRVRTRPRARGGQPRDGDTVFPGRVGNVGTRAPG